MNPDVTLVIPNFNGEKYLPQILPSLLRQTYATFSILVVDNCSTDQSATVVRGFTDPRLRLVEADRHVDIVDNFNRGVALVETPFFAICACDELYEPTWLETMMSLMAQAPDAFFACCKADTVDDHGRVYLSGAEKYKGLFWPAREPCVFTPAQQIWKLQRINFMVLTLGIFRTAAARQLGPLNPDLHYVSDWEYWVRGFLAGYPAIGTHRRLAHYRRHGGMTSQSLNRQLRSFQELLHLARWIPRVAHEKGWLPSAEPNYAMVGNALLAHLGACLRAGDRETADKVIAFAQENIPGFSRSWFSTLMKGSRALGRLGGCGLQASERAYLSLLALGYPRPQH